MMKFLLSLALAIIATNAAQARGQFAAECNVTMPCIGAPAPQDVPGVARRTYNRDRADVSASGINPTLAAKVASIRSACPGTAIISGMRHTYVAGTRRISLHASGHAVDVRGPYSCIYGQLKGWPGGYSIDAGRMHHIHISYGGREDGLRFRHGHHRKKRR